MSEFKYIANEMDRKDVLLAVQKKYPLLTETNTPINNKKIFVNLLDDTAFMHEILNKYNITIYEFLLYIAEEYTFFRSSSIYLKKIKKILISNNYIPNDISSGEEEEKEKEEEKQKNKKTK